MTEILALVLFGSRARGDHDDRSDVDLLALAGHCGPTFSARPGVTISCYPLDHVLRRARSGDLFAFHLVAEGKVLYEREPVFNLVQRAFCFRSDYTREIEMASDVGWFLLHHCDPAVERCRLQRADVLVHPRPDRRPGGDATPTGVLCERAGRLRRFARRRHADPSQASRDPWMPVAWKRSAPCWRPLARPSRRRWPRWPTSGDGLKTPRIPPA